MDTNNTDPVRAREILARVIAAEESKGYAARFGDEQRHVPECLALDAIAAALASAPPSATAGVDEVRPDYRPAFDMPTTAAEALAWLTQQGDPTCMTFSPAKAKRAAELLGAALQQTETDPVTAAALAELNRAVQKFPTWPTDPLHAVAVLGEEFGELTKAVLQSVYEPHKVKPGDVQTEAVQVAAMALRFLRSLHSYEFTPGAQHEQPALSQQPAAPERAAVRFRTTEMNGHDLQQHSDSWVCDRCSRVFDVNDPDIPECEAAPTTGATPPSAPVGVEASYHPCTSILIEGLKRLEGGSDVLAEWDRARAKADTALSKQPADVDGMVMVQASDLKTLAEFADRGMRGNPAKLAALRAKAILAAQQQEVQ